MERNVQIEDHTMWFKHIHDPALRERLSGLKDGEPISLESDGVVGLWRRMLTGKDGRPTPGIRPVGPMKDVWNKWFKARKGQAITVRETTLADDYLAAGSALFSEWNSPQDEEAFCDL